MKKIIACMLSLVCVLALVAGCSTRASIAFTYTIDNGDAIRVELNAKDKFRLSSDVPFTISQDGQELTTGSFIQSYGYQEYVDAVTADEKATILDSGTKDGNEYVFWNYNNEEFNYVILVGGSNTGILMANCVSEESARECFNRLTITVEK